MTAARWSDRLAGLFRWRQDTPAGPGGPRVIERESVLIIRAFVVGLLAYYLFGSGLADTGPGYAWEQRGSGLHEAWRTALRTVQALFFLYLALSVGTGILLLGIRHLKPPARQGLIFGVALLDAWFLGAIVAITGGVESLLYWLYPLLLVRNCRSLSSVALQMGLNLLTVLGYAGGALTDAYITRLDTFTQPDNPELIGSPLPPTGPRDARARCRRRRACERSRLGHGWSSRTL